MAYVAQNGLWLSRSADPTPYLSAGSYIEAIANGDVRLASLQSNVNIASEAQVNIGTTSLPKILQVGSNDDVVSIEASALDVRSGRVLVRDGEITLAARDTIGQVTASAMDGAGILVGDAGLPTEQSIRWSRGHAELPSSEAAATAAAGGRSNVGTWDVRGGGLRLIAESADSEVAYGFRINADLELELYRRDTNKANGQVTYNRVSRFGNSIGSNSVAMLPTSPVL